MEVGGWNSRTTVEDMDLSLRAYLAGWKGMYLRDVTCLNEVRVCILGQVSHMVNMLHVCIWVDITYATSSA